MTPSSPPVVLIVDDHADTRDMYAQFLQAMGLETQEASTCAEVFAMTARDGIDAIVLDRRLPDGDGAEVCRGLKSDPHTRALPIVVLSGREHDGTTGADAYLMKPVSPDHLFSELQRLLARRDGGPKA